MQHKRNEIKPHYVDLNCTHHNNPKRKSLFFQLVTSTAL